MKQLSGYKTVITACLILLIVVVAGADLKASEIVCDSVPSGTLGRDWSLHVYLPVGYQPVAAEKYPVLFLLHGSQGDETDWDRAFPVLDSLIAAGKLPPLIAIAPATGTSWWVDGREQFETAFFKDLLPYISEKYPLLDRREGRVVAGFSMGGYGALRYGLAHPEIFGGAILLSPAIYAKLPPPESSARLSGSFGAPFSDERWVNRNFTTILPDYIRQEHRVYFFIAVGDDDWNHPEGIEYNIEQQTVHLYGLLNKQYSNPAELRIVNGGHSWKIWLPLFQEGLEVMSRELTPFGIEVK